VCVCMCVCVRARERVVSVCVTLRVFVCVYVYVWLGGALSTAFPALSHCVCDTVRVCTVRLRGMETGISEASKRVSIFSFATQGGKQVSLYFRQGNSDKDTIKVYAFCLSKTHCLNTVMATRTQVREFLFFWELMRL